MLAALTAAGVAFCISTTSPKPRVPASITACKLDEYFPADKVRGELFLSLCSSSSFLSGFRGRLILVLRFVGSRSGVPLLLRFLFEYVFA